MERVKIKVDGREFGKKGVNARLRRTGFVPAILYGHSQEPLGLSVNGKEITRLLKGASGLNILFDIEWSDGKGKTQMVMVKDYQTDILTRQLTHIDFLNIDLKEKVLIKVPLVTVGKAPGLAEGGLLELIRRELEVRCLPTSIPDKIEIDVSTLALGHTLHIRDIKFPEGVEVAPVQLDLAVVSVALPREEVVETPTAAAAVPGAEGAAAAGAAAPAADAKAGDAKAAPAKADAKAPAAKDKK